VSVPFHAANAFYNLFPLSTSRCSVGRWFFISFYLFGGVLGGIVALHCPAVLARSYVYFANSENCHNIRCPRHRGFTGACRCIWQRPCTGQRPEWWGPGAQCPPQWPRWSVRVVESATRWRPRSSPISKQHIRFGILSFWVLFPLPSCRNCCCRWDWLYSPRRVAPDWSHPSGCSRHPEWFGYPCRSPTLARPRSRGSRWCHSSQSCPSAGSTSGRWHPHSRPASNWWWSSARSFCSRPEPCPWRRRPVRRQRSRPPATGSRRFRTARAEIMELVLDQLYFLIRNNSIIIFGYKKPNYFFKFLNT